MRNVQYFLLDGFESLQSLSIGWHSFASVSTGDCIISNCPLLSSIHFGDYAFEDYHYFVLQNVPSLQSITMSQHNFHASNLFGIHRISFIRRWLFLDVPELKQSLKTLSIGSYSFRNVIEVNLDGFNELTSLSIGEYAFDSKVGYLSIWNCSKLHTIAFGRYAFQNADALTLHDLPQLQSITFNQFAFQNTKTASLNNIGKIIGLVLSNNCLEKVEYLSITGTINCIH